MVPVYGSDIAHKRRKGEDPLRPNFSCYMWWDVIPIHCGMKHHDQKGINEAVLEVFRRALELKSEACLESVLHGLGHWAPWMRPQVESIVREFLRTRHDISEELRAYAEQAATGGVL